jgi:hypothetical protein
VEISGAAAEEGDCVAVISDNGFDFVHIPKLMLLLPYDLVHLALMGRFIRRFPGLWIAPTAAQSYTLAAPGIARPLRPPQPIEMVILEFGILAPKPGYAGHSMSPDLESAGIREDPAKPAITS